MKVSLTLRGTGGVLVVLAASMIGGGACFTVVVDDVLVVVVDSFVVVVVCLVVVVVVVVVVVEVVGLVVEVVVDDVFFLVSGVSGVSRPAETFCAGFCVARTSCGLDNDTGGIVVDVVVVVGRGGATVLPGVLDGAVVVVFAADVTLTVNGGVIGTGTGRDVTFNRRRTSSRASL